MLRFILSLLVLTLFREVPLHAASVFYVTTDGQLFGHPRVEITDAASALAALATPPTAAEVGQVLVSGVLPGTTLLRLLGAGEITVVDFSVEIVGSGLDEARQATIFEQVRATLAQFGVSGSIEVQADGQRLSSYLRPPPDVGPRKHHKVGGKAGTGALNGKVISISPGHGRYWSGSSWVFARPVYCAPLSREDDHNVEIAQYLATYLAQDGAVTKVYRNLDKTYGNYPTGEAWWRMAASYWTQQLGYPCSVYASSTGDCNLGGGTSESSDAIRAGPVAANYDDTDAHIALHSNGLNGDCTGSACPNGTVTYYDSDASHATWTLVSSNLAKRVNTAIVEAIRTRYTDTTWRDRSVADALGAFAETRIPNRPAILIELAFHDSCDRDGLYLQDNFFRSTTMWGVYKGICQHFGVTPTWDYYSYEIVTNTLPTAMAPGAIVTAQITLRNRGVLWSDSRQFHLGAVGDSDPFSSVTRFNVGNEVEPNSTKTFSITLTAPTSPGTYTSDWRMVREGVTWFGPVLSRSIVVQASPSFVTLPVSQSVVVGSNVTLTAVMAGAIPLRYQWRFNGTDLPGATASSFSRLGAQFVHSGNYDVVVSNAFGVVTSAPAAALTVTLPPAFQPVFVDLFDTNSASRWAVNRSSADTRVTFQYDYAADGIAAAPGAGGTTRGVRFDANLATGVPAAVSISPVGQSFTGDYRLRFNLWLNANGPFPEGGPGSTQHGTAGIGTAGNRVQWTGAGSTADGLWFAVDGEGQASDTSTTSINDFAAFNGSAVYAATSGAYAAGSVSNARGNLNSYYAGTFPGGQTAPAWQQSAYPQQSGGLAVGTIGFAWREVIIQKSGSNVAWSIDGLPLATITGATFTASNICLGYWDTFASLSDNLALSFGLVDNVRVEGWVTNAPPFIAAQPADAVVKVGHAGSFQVSAGGTIPLAYQWRRNGTNLPSATAGSLTINSAQMEDAGDYSVLITNVAGMVTSSSALLTVIPPAPLKFEGLAWLPDGRLKLRLRGEPGVVTIERSATLTHWSFLASLTNVTGEFEFTEALATNTPAVFYRARQ